MTGKQFKALAKRLHGHKWATSFAKLLNVHRTTIWRYASMAQVPSEVVRKLSKHP